MLISSLCPSSFATILLQSAFNNLCHLLALARKLRFHKDMGRIYNSRKHLCQKPTILFNYSGKQAWGQGSFEHFSHQKNCDLSPFWDLYVHVSLVSCTPLNCQNILSVYSDAKFLVIIFYNFLNPPFVILAANIWLSLWPDGSSFFSHNFPWLYWATDDPNFYHVISVFHVTAKFICAFQAL